MSGRGCGAVRWHGLCLAHSPKVSFFAPPGHLKRRRRASEVPKQSATNSPQCFITGHAPPPGRPGKERSQKVEVTKALAALQPLYGKGNVEIVTDDGARVRGTVRSLRTTQALTKPSVKIERADGEVVKIPFNVITEIIDHNDENNRREEEPKGGFFGRRFTLGFF